MFKTSFFVFALLVGVVSAQTTTGKPTTKGPLPNAPREERQSGVDFPSNSSTNCGQSPIDLVFVVDVSGSVGQSNYDKMNAALRSTVKNLNIGNGADQTHVGLVTFSSDARIMFGLDEKTNNQDLDQAIAQVPYTQGGTNITSGMLAGVDAFQGQGNRPDIPDIMVVITDGQDSSDVQFAHQQAENLGITVFAVGIGDAKNLDLNQLGIVAGAQDHVFISDNFTFLEQVLSRDICGKIEETVNPTPPPKQLDRPQTQAPINVENLCPNEFEVFDACGGCEVSCGNFTTLCSKGCDVDNARCRCQIGFIRNENGTCVRPEQCCSENEVFDACGGCEEQCDKGAPLKLNCIDGCNFDHARCRCEKGFVRDVNGDCIERSICAPQKTPQEPQSTPKPVNPSQPTANCNANEILRCPTGCEGTCAQQHPHCVFSDPIKPTCRFQRCECPIENGFVRDRFRRCFHSSLCPNNNPLFESSGFDFPRPHPHPHPHFVPVRPDFSSSSSESDEHAFPQPSDWSASSESVDFKPHHHHSFKSGEFVQNKPLKKDHGHKHQHQKVESGSGSSESKESHPQKKPT